MNIMPQLRKPRPSPHMAATIIQRAFRKRKQASIGVSSAKSAPVTVAVTRGKLVNTSSINIHGEEFLGNVEFSLKNTYFDSESISGSRVITFTNPLYWTNSRAQKTIKNFSEWQLRKVRYEFVPTVGTGWSGTMHMALVHPSDHIAADSNVSELASAMSILPSYKSIPLQSVGISAVERSMSAVGPKCTKSDPDPDAHMFVMVGTGILNASSADPNDLTVIGGLYVSYDLTCSGPCPPWEVISNSEFIYSVKTDSPYYAMTNTKGFGTPTTWLSNLTPTFGRVTIGSDASLVPGRTPEWASATMVTPGSTIISGNSNYGMGSGLAPWLGQKYAYIVARQTNGNMTLAGVTHSFAFNELKLSEVASGLDISSIIASSTWGMAPAVGVWEMFRLSTYLIPYVRGFSGNGSLALSLSSRARVSEAEETPEVVTTTTTTTTTTPEPAKEPTVARGRIVLPAIRI